MIIRIKRQENANTKPYIQEFLYEGEKDVSIAHVLDRLNYDDDLFDREGNPARRIRWSCSCMQKICGACAMVINGMPALACDTFLNELKKDVVTLAPLSKFPVVSDLIVDRSKITESLLEAKLFDERITGPEKEHEHKYLISKCLKCGICLELCPNFTGRGDFYGAIMANDSFLIYADNGSRKKEIKDSYKKHFEKGCSKALSCMAGCPMKIKTLSSIGFMNRKK